MLCSQPTTSCNMQCYHLHTTLNTTQIPWYIPWLGNLYQAIKVDAQSYDCKKIGKLCLEKTLGVWHKATTRRARRVHMQCLSWHMKRYNMWYKLVKNLLGQPSGWPLPAKGGWKSDSNNRWRKFDQLQWRDVGPHRGLCHSKTPLEQCREQSVGKVHMSKVRI